MCDNNDYCRADQFNKILKYNYGEKSLTTPFVIYADLQCLLLKQQSCQNNPNESYTERKAMHEPCGYALSLISSFDSRENKHDFYRGKDCIKRFCSDLKELATKTINYEKEKSKRNVTYIKKSFVMIKMKKINLKYTKKLEIIVIIQENLEELLIAFVI